MTVAIINVVTFSFSAFSTQGLSPRSVWHVLKNDAIYGVTISGGVKLCHPKLHGNTFPNLTDLPVSSSLCHFITAEPDSIIQYD